MNQTKFVTSAKQKRTTTTTVINIRRICCRIEHIVSYAVRSVSSTNSRIFFFNSRIDGKCASTSALWPKLLPLPPAKRPTSPANSHQPGIPPHSSPDHLSLFCECFSKMYIPIPYKTRVYSDTLCIQSVYKNKYNILYIYYNILVYILYIQY